MEAFFGKRRGRFEEAYKIQYGSMDSITVTERNTEHSAVKIFTSMIRATPFELGAELSPIY